MVHGPTSPAVHPQSAHWRRPRHSQSSILISRPGPPRRPAGLKLSFPPAPAQILAPACQAGPQPGGRPQARRQCPVLAAAESPPIAARARCVAQHHLPQRQTVRLEPWHLSPGSASRAITNVLLARCARCPAGAGRRPEHPPVCLMRMCPVLIPRPELPRPGPVRHQATVRQACEGVHASLSLSSLSRLDSGLSLSGTVLVRQPLTVPRFGGFPRPAGRRIRPRTAALESTRKPRHTCLPETSSSRRAGPRDGQRRPTVRSCSCGAADHWTVTSCQSPPLRLRLLPWAWPGAPSPAEASRGCPLSVARSDPSKRLMVPGLPPAQERQGRKP